MALQEDDREDLIREATALKPRVEWRVPGEPDLVFCGLKRDGSLSLYFGQNPVYQFNSRGELRRAWVDWFLYRTQGTTLARLQRKRSGEETVLLRTDLAPAELETFIAVMDQRIEQLLRALSAGECEVMRVVSEGPLPDFASRLMQILTAVPRLSAALVKRLKTDSPGNVTH